MAQDQIEKLIVCHQTLQDSFHVVRDGGFEKVSAVIGRSEAYANRYSGDWAERMGELCQKIFMNYHRLSSQMQKTANGYVQMDSRAKLVSKENAEKDHVKSMPSDHFANISEKRVGVYNAMIALTRFSEFRDVLSEYLQVQDDENVAVRDAHLESKVAVKGVDNAQKLHMAQQASGIPNFLADLMDEASGVKVQNIAISKKDIFAVAAEAVHDDLYDEALIKQEMIGDLVIFYDFLQTYWLSKADGVQDEIYESRKNAAFAMMEFVEYEIVRMFELSERMVPEIKNAADTVQNFRME